MNKDLEPVFYALLFISLAIRFFNSDWFGEIFQKKDTSIFSGSVPFSSPPTYSVNRFVEFNTKTLDDTALTQVVQFLREKLPSKPTLRNLPFIVNHTQGMDQWPQKRLEAYYLEYAGEVLKFMFLPPLVRMEVVYTIDSPCLYTLYDGIPLLQIKPGIAAHSVYWATIAHELTRHYLAHHKVAAPEGVAAEYFVEIAAVYLGFGFQRLKKYQDTKELYVRAGSTLDRDTTMRAIITTAIIRKQQPFYILNQFHSSNRKWAKRQLLPLIQDYRAHVAAKSDKPETDDDGPDLGITLPSQE